MKKIRKKFMIISFLFILMFSIFPGEINAVNVVKSYKYDYNILGYSTNYHGYQYKNIPDSAVFLFSDEIFIKGGFNYKRYQVIYYYRNYKGLH